MSSPANTSPDASAPKRWRAWLLGVASVGIISLPLVVLPWKNSTASLEDIKKYEQREAAAWPSWPITGAGWEMFPKAVEAYVNDHFALRSLLVGIHHRLKLQLGIAPSETVAIGKNGWLFFRPQEWDDVRGLATQSFKEKASYCVFLNNVHDSLQREGVPFLFVVAPDKSSVYPEQLPSNVEGGSHKHRLDDLLAFLKKHGCRAQILDLRKAMAAGKREGQLFYKQDTHWNYLGAALGAREILSRLNTLGVTVEACPVLPEDFTQAPAPTHDLADMIQQKGNEMVPVWKKELGSKFETDFAARKLHAFYPSAPPLSEACFSTRCQAGKGRLLLFHDSFAISMKPMLSTSFEWVGYLWCLPDADTTEQVRALRPTAVVWETVERYVGLMPVLPGNDAAEVYSQFLTGVAFEWSKKWVSSLSVSAEVVDLICAGKKIRLTITGSNGQIMLKNPLALKKGYKVLGCRVRSPAATTFTVLGKSASNSSGNVMWQAALEEGWNEVFLPLSEEAFQGTISIKPGEVAGDYEIKDLIIRDE